MFRNLMGKTGNKFKVEKIAVSINNYICKSIYALLVEI